MHPTLRMNPVPQMARRRTRRPRRSQHLETSAARIEGTVQCMSGQWRGNATLNYPPVLTDLIDTLREGPCTDW